MRRFASPRCRREIPGFVALLVTAAVAVSCSDKSAKTPEPAPPVVGADGGTVTEPGGAKVIVPPGAIETAVTIRIAKDSTGAPAVPAGLGAAGDTYAITPHGAGFVVPVEVRIPAPAVTLTEYQELKLAKAEPGGEWQVLGDTTLADGVLSAAVTDFSFFMPVVVSYIVPMAQAEPLRMVTTSSSCGDQSCTNAVGPVTYTFAFTTNSGQPPAGCGDVGFRVRETSSHGQTYTAFPRSGGTLTRALDPSYGRYQLALTMTCPSRTYTYTQGNTLTWSSPIAWPGVRPLRAPYRLDVVEGLVATIDVVLEGGASTPNGTDSYGPTPEDRATVDWERSDDEGGSWRTVARSYENEANLFPYGDLPGGRHYWSVRHGFVASAADQGARIRARACYVPSGVPAEPCRTGYPTLVNVLRSSALAAIVDAPRSVLVTAGQTASFSATASGAPAPTLQWQTRAANSTGAWTDVASGTGSTTGSYTTAVLALADNGTQYRVVATNALGSAASAPVTASVSALDVAPTITTQPASLAVVSGSDAAFAIAARGTEALGYQWRRGGTPIPGANGPVLRLAAVTATNAGGYDVVVTNAAGTATSDLATLAVGPGVPPAVAPTIVTQPAAVTVSAGNTATFAVGVSGTGPISFQWRKDGVAVPGATEAALTFPSAAAGDAGVYSVVVSSSAGTVTSAGAALQISADPPPVATAPVITTQPSTLVVMPGGAATLAVAASGTGPLTYAWTHDGVAVPGVTGPVLHLASVTALDAGSYQVTVGNTAGSAPSSTAQLVVVGTPTITAHPSDASALVGGTATFSVGATGEALRFQWLRDRVEIPGATLASYTTPALALADSGAVFSVIVYSGAGIAISQVAVLTVTSAPAVTATTLESVSTAGVVADNVSVAPELSADGRLLVFSSQGTNLVAGITTDPAGSVFVRDLGAGVTTLVNQTPAGGPSSGAARQARFAAGGRFVVFASLAGDLVDGDTNGSQDVFLRDLQAGTTKRLNVTADGAQITGAGNAVYESRSGISADGRWVTFLGAHDVLGTGDPLPNYTLFLRDTQNDVTRLVTADPNGGYYVNVTSDGSQVIYLAATFAPSFNHLLSYDIATGVTTTLFSLDTATWPDGISGVSVSDTGRYVAFTMRSATELGGVAASVSQVVVLDRNAPPGTLTLASTGPSGAGDGSSGYPRISGDGRFVLFSTKSPALTGDPAATVSPYLMVRDLVGLTTRIASRRADGSAVKGIANAPDVCAVSQDGSLVAFSADLGPAGLPPGTQVYVAPRP